LFASVAFASKKVDFGRSRPVEILRVQRTGTISPEAVPAKERKFPSTGALGGEVEEPNPIDTLAGVAELLGASMPGPLTAPPEAIGCMNGSERDSLTPGYTTLGADFSR